MKDRLKQLFDEQLKLNKKCNPEFAMVMNTKDNELKRKWLDNVCDALYCEVAELKETGADFKWWKKKPDWTPDLEHNAKIELVDILHFLILGFQVLGVDDKEMWDLYLKKNKLNHKRQEEGYREGTYNKIDKNGKEDNYYLKTKKIKKSLKQLVEDNKYDESVLKLGGK